MRIAIILAISVIFASGTYTAFADEPIPELIFEGGTYEIYKGNQILVPIKVQVENHDHTVVPIITTISCVVSPPSSSVAETLIENSPSSLSKDDWIFSIQSLQHTEIIKP